MGKTFFKVLFINLLLLEVLSFLLIRVFYIEQPPRSYKHQFLPYFIDTEQSFSTWHYKNLSTRHIGPKWNVAYQFNSYGARDVERTEKSNEKRFIFLGDSFLEGYGVKENHRLSNLLEKSTNKECLNFAVSGIGQTQMNMIYTDIASNFSHDVVFIGFYPFNDFRENSFSNREKYFNDRYRPYRIKDSTDNFSIKYHLASAEESAFHSSKYSPKSYLSSLSHSIKSDMKWPKKMQTIFYDFTYSGALVKGALVRINHIVTKKDALNFEMEKTDHHLEHTVSEDWEILEYELSSIKKKTSGRPIVLLFIPHPADFSYRKSVRQLSPVQNKAKELCSKLDIHYIDFLEELPAKEVKKLYIKNDDHWSAYGNKKAHEVLKKKLHGLKITL